MPLQSLQLIDVQETLRASGSVACTWQLSRMARYIALLRVLANADLVVKQLGCEGVGEPDLLRNLCECLARSFLGRKKLTNQIILACMQFLLSTNACSSATYVESSCCVCHTVSALPYSNTSHMTDHTCKYRPN